jgi:hypothetical protein
MSGSFVRGTGRMPKIKCCEKIYTSGYELDMALIGKYR